MVASPNNDVTPRAATNGLSNGANERESHCSVTQSLVECNQSKNRETQEEFSDFPASACVEDGENAASW